MNSSCQTGELPSHNMVGTCKFTQGLLHKYKLKETYSLKQGDVRTVLFLKCRHSCGAVVHDDTRMDKKSVVVLYPRPGQSVAGGLMSCENMNLCSSHGHVLSCNLIPIRRERLINTLVLQNTAVWKTLNAFMYVGGEEVPGNCIQVLIPPSS